MAATMHDVAQLAGVSMKTVSNVIHEHPHVRATTRERVRAAIDQLGYRPNMSARGLRSGRTGVIGLAVPSLRENYFAELADAVIRAAERRGLSVLVEQTGGEHDREAEVLTDERARLTDGLLFNPVALRKSDAPLLDTAFPLVLLGERIFGGPTDHVTMHNVSAARAAVEHLIDIGRRRIAVIGAEHDVDDEASSARLRVAGYVQALEGANIPVDTDLVRVGPHWSRATGAMSIRDLLRDGIRFDAVFALNDSLGLGALRALGEAGLRSPEDVAVIGFDNIDEAQFTVPSMSSVDVGRDQIATDAVDMLVRRIEDKAPGQRPRTVKPDYRIIRRESTGFPVHGREDMDGERV